jgi:hypothetical protein
MAVIEIRTEPSGRTRMLFDLSAVAPGRDDVKRIAGAMAQSCAQSPVGPASVSVEPAAQPRVKRQAAPERNTSRPVTVPSRRRISAS